MMEKDEFEITFKDAVSSPSINRLSVKYKSYLQRAIREISPSLLTLEEFYWESRTRGVLVSKTFEKYLKLVQTKKYTSEEKK